MLFMIFFSTLYQVSSMFKEEDIIVRIMKLDDQLEKQHAILQEYKLVFDNSNVIFRTSYADRNTYEKVPVYLLRHYGFVYKLCDCTDIYILAPERVMKRLNWPFTRQSSHIHAHAHSHTYVFTHVLSPTHTHIQTYRHTQHFHTHSNQQTYRHTTYPYTYSRQQFTHASKSS